jgi:hypothetical protein
VCERFTSLHFNVASCQNQYFATHTITQVRSAARELLEGGLPKDQADDLAQKLSEGRWTHDYPIFPAEAEAMGLNVSTEMALEILELLALYPQPMRTQGGVEYLPIPRQRHSSRRE